MSKYVKELMIDQFRQEFGGLEEAMVVDISLMTNDLNTALRAELRKSELHLRVVKNSLARLATKGTALEPAFRGVEGSAALLYGKDIVALAKEVLRLRDDKKYQKFFTPKGGAIGGQKIGPDEIDAVSKWPSREQVLSTISGQILGVGATLSAQLLGPGRRIGGQLTSVGAALASQIAKKGEEAPAT